MTNAEMSSIAAVLALAFMLVMLVAVFRQYWLLDALEKVAGWITIALAALSCQLWLIFYFLSEVHK